MAAPTLLAAVAALALAGATSAQTVGPPAKRNNNTYGSPLDTLKSSRLWTDTPEPKDFVRASRPPAGTLDYTPLTGTDPERAKPRDAANVAALQAEMERAGARLAGTTGRPRAAGRAAEHPRRRRAAAAEVPPAAEPVAQAAAAAAE